MQWLTLLLPCLASADSWIQSKSVKKYQNAQPLARLKQRLKVSARGTQNSLEALSMAFLALHPPTRRLQQRASLRPTRSSPILLTEPGNGENTGSDESKIPSTGDVLVNAISKDGSISAKAIITTDLVSEASRFQGLSDLAAAAVGRTVTCAIMLSDGQEPEETLQFKFNGDGPLGSCLGISNGRLEARGLVGNPKARLPPNAQGKIDVGGGIGKGSFSTVRVKNLPGQYVPTPYESITQIVSGEIPEDINYYLYTSEQRQGALAAGVYVEGLDGRPDLNGDVTGGAAVTAAGGWYVTILPFADDESITKLEANIAALAKRSVTSMIRDGLRPEDIIKELLAGLEPQILQHRLVPSLSSSCPCSEDRIYRTLALLPRSQVEEILEEQGGMEVVCDFCKKKNQMDAETIRKRLDAFAD
mmetsp:Transcript_4707/g.7675  ORF Transcript_4707/g.7675 Transcript_4707/m.7675 type:complete len:417 (+) Transcript_4707:62-1312(+)